MTSFPREDAYFKTYHDDIVKGHIGEYVIIKGLEIMGYYKDWPDGIVDMRKRGYEYGTYITCPCTKEIEPMEIWTPGVITWD